MQAVQVIGRFTRGGEPVEGYIKFTPSRIWCEEEDGTTYPCLAPEGELINGHFLVYLTKTNQHLLDWHYTVECPMGKWTIKVEVDGPVNLKDLLPKKLA